MGDTLVTRNMLSSSMYTGKPPIPIDKWISSPTMKTDTRPVQLRFNPFTPKAGVNMAH